MRAGGEGVGDVGAGGVGWGYVGLGWVGWKWMFIEFEEGLFEAYQGQYCGNGKLNLNKQ